MNVKTPYKGCRFRNKYCNPLRVNEEHFRFLSVFCERLESWNSIYGRNKLTNETFIALHHTTYAFLELTNYCIEELKIQYILPNKFQTDHLVVRFGQYRQFSWDKYSIQQVFECEKNKNAISFKIELTIQSEMQ